MACIAFLAAKLGGGNADRWLRLLRDILVAEFLVLVALCIVGYVYEHRAQARDAKLYPPPGRLIDIGGYRLHLNCSGEGGTTVVLEYGLEGSYLDWHRVQPEIARFGRVCSYDRGGYGWSDTSPRPRVPSVMAEELYALLRAAGEKPPYIVVGHSYGVLVAEMFAYKFPQETAGLVLVDGFILRGEPWFPTSYKLWLRFMQWTTPLGLPRWRGWCGGARGKLRDEAEAANCRSRVYAAYYQEHSQLAVGGAEVRAIGSLGDVPLIVISRDPAVTHEPDGSGHAEDQAEMARLSSKGTLVIAKGSGHNVPEDRPDVIIEAIRELSARAQADSRGTQ